MEVEIMSFAHFDEIYEIILDLMEEEVMLKARLPVERNEPVRHPVTVEHHWWEEAVTEIKIEKEKEELYV
jgi:hypothetical protein